MSIVFDVVEVLNPTKISANHSPGKGQPSQAQAMSIIDINQPRPIHIYWAIDFIPKHSWIIFPAYRKLHLLQLTAKHHKQFNLQTKNQERERLQRHFPLTNVKRPLQKSKRISNRAGKLYISQKNIFINCYQHVFKYFFLFRLNYNLPQCVLDHSWIGSSLLCVKLIHFYKTLAVVIDYF